MRALLFAAVAVWGLAACTEAAQGAPETGAAAVSDGPDLFAKDVSLAPLPELFDCLRKSGGVVVSAHRGGPAPGYPENALETLQNGLAMGVHTFEVDVAESRDGVLFLYHDPRFGRVARGDGYVSDTDWATIAKLRLKDDDGELTGYHPPKLTDALVWARTNGAILKLDKKETTAYRNIVATVRAAEAEHNVILVTYSDEDAGAVAGLAPELMMTASVRGGRDIAKLEALGVDRSRVIAWTGTRAPDPPAFDRLLKEGVEPAFGTLGREGERLDDQYWEDGDGSEYQRLVDDGVVMIDTDEAVRVADYLIADDDGWAACAVR